MLIHIIFGAPGTGKGTRGPQIALNLGARHISTGDLFVDKDLCQQIISDAKNIMLGL
jgi:cytidylate kinase